MLEVRFRRSASLFLVLWALASAGFSAPLSLEEREALGIEDSLPLASSPSLPPISAAPGVRGSSTFLLIPDSTADRIMAFDPTTGNLVNANLVPADGTNLSTPKAAILHAGGNDVLVSDQIRDLVQRYASTGYVGALAPLGGVNNAILDNITGATYHPNGNLLVCVQSGPNGNSVASFDASGNHLGNFIAIGSGGLAGPFDLLIRTSDVLVSSINTDSILRYDRTTGAFLDVFATINNFPQQLHEAANGNILVANFSGTQSGIVELTSTGTLVGVYNPQSTGYRGVFELPNGNLLVTTGAGVFEISRANALVDTKMTGVSAQYIELATGVFPVELESFSID